MIKRAALSKPDTWTAYTFKYWGAVRYGLPVSTFTRKECDAIQQKSTYILLSALGFNPHYPRAAVYGPDDFGGIGLFHVYTEQGVLGTMLMLKYARCPDTHIGNILQVALAWAQMEAGISTPIMEDTQTHIPYLTEGWIVMVRDFLHSIRGSLHIPPTLLPLPMRPPRENDQCLMEFLIPNKWSDRKLTTINNCRCHLRAIYISDICNAAGTEILPKFYATHQRPNWHPLGNGPITKSLLLQPGASGNVPSNPYAPKVPPNLNKNLAHGDICQTTDPSPAPTASSAKSL
jgi:hypothetical protein